MAAELTLEQVTIPTATLERVHARIGVPFERLLPPHERIYCVRPTPAGVEWSLSAGEAGAALVAGSGTLTRAHGIAAITVGFLVTAAQRTATDAVTVRFDDDGPVGIVGDLRLRAAPVDASEPPSIRTTTPVEVDRAGLEAAVIGVTAFGSVVEDAPWVHLTITDGRLRVTAPWNVETGDIDASVPVTGSWPGSVTCDPAHLLAVLGGAGGRQIALGARPGQALVVRGATGFVGGVRSHDLVLDRIDAVIEEAGNVTDISDDGTAVELDWDDGGSITATAVRTLDPLSDERAVRWGRTLLAPADWTSTLAAELNALNQVTSTCRFVWRDDAVHVETSMALDAFTPDEFEARCAEIARLTEAYGPLLVGVHGPRPV